MRVVVSPWKITISWDTPGIFLRTRYRVGARVYDDTYYTHRDAHIVPWDGIGISGFIRRSK